MNPITPSQEAYLKLIELSGTWNEFDGIRIAQALRDNKALWRSAFFCRHPLPMNPPFLDRPEPRLEHLVDLVTLRDLPDNSVNLDRIYLFTEPGRQADLESLARAWKPDDIYWYDSSEAENALGVHPLREWQGGKCILVLWWD
jgi:hypothetical protein